MSQKIGPDGRPVRETYQTKASGVLDDKGRTKLGERQQHYQNELSGYEKLGHEWIYDGRGRKYVTEGVGSQKNTYQYYKGIEETQAWDFDSEWEAAA